MSCHLPAEVKSLRQAAIKFEMDPHTVQDLEREWVCRMLTRVQVDFENLYDRLAPLPP